MKAILTSLDGLPADTQKEYSQITDGVHKGKYMLKVEAADGFALDDIEGLKNTVSATRAERDRLATQFKDIDPVKAREALAKLEEIKKWTPDDKTKELVEGTKKQLAEKFTAELTDKEKALAQRDNQIAELLIVSAATSAAASLKGNVKLLLPHIKSQCRVVMKDGVPVAQVIGENGNPRLSLKAGSTAEMTVPEFVESLRDNPDFAVCFAGSGSKGSGGHKGSAADGKELPPSTLSPTQKLAAIRASGR
jgi:hypothetical protein